MPTPVQLTRLEDLCKEWSTIHSQYCNLSNIQPQTFTRVIYKQSREIEEILHKIFEEFEKIMKSMEIFYYKVINSFDRHKFIFDFLHRNFSEFPTPLPPITSPGHPSSHH
ncbi:2462_t:CDS:2, partial [Gigaspora rosea]